MYQLISKLDYSNEKSNKEFNSQLVNSTIWLRNLIKYFLNKKASLTMTTKGCTSIELTTCEGSEGARRGGGGAIVVAGWGDSSSPMGTTSGRLIAREFQQKGGRRALARCHAAMPRHMTSTSASSDSYAATCGRLMRGLRQRCHGTSSISFAPRRRWCNLEDGLFRWV